MSEEREYIVAELKRMIAEAEKVGDSHTVMHLYRQLKPLQETAMNETQYQVNGITVTETAFLKSRIANYRSELECLRAEVEQLQAEVHWLEKVEMKVLQKEIDRQRTVIKTLETSDWFAERARANSLQFEIERLQSELVGIKLLNDLQEEAMEPEVDERLKTDELGMADGHIRYLQADNKALRAEVNHLRSLVVYYESDDGERDVMNNNEGTLVTIKRVFDTDMGFLPDNIENALETISDIIQTWKEKRVGDAR